MSPKQCIRTYAKHIVPCAAPSTETNSYNWHNVLGRVCNTSKAKYTGSIYFRETAANDATNIATATQATALTDVTLEIPAGYSTGYVMVSAACRIESVTVNYVDGVTTYTIADPRPKTTINITTPEGYSTFVCDHAYVMPEGFMGSAATISENKLIWDWEYEEGAVVPANTPLLIFGTETSVEAELTAEEGTTPETNYLVANTTGATAQASTLAPSADKFYVLSYDTNNENLGFYWLTSDGSSFDVPAGKVFLYVPSGVQAPARFIFGDTETAIKSISTLENGAMCSGSHATKICMDENKSAVLVAFPLVHANISCTSCRFISNKSKAWFTTHQWLFLLECCQSLRQVCDAKDAMFAPK